MNPWEYTGRLILALFVLACSTGLFFLTFAAFAERKNAAARVYLYILATFGLAALLAGMFLALDQLLSPVRALEEAGKP